MMLPGAAPAVARHARDSGTVRAAALFTGAYLGVWALAGLVAYGLDRPHGSLAAGIVVIAAGAYELTPVKRHYRRRCRESAGSGLGFGLCCVGSSLGLMAMLVALDVMSLLWMAVVAVVACAQKLLPAKAAVDVPLALALIALGLVIVIEPSLIPGLVPPAM
jgi:predicted metal-binding membrane protein